MRPPLFVFGSMTLTAALVAAPALSAPGGIPGPPGGGEEAAVNNLSFPVHFTGSPLAIPGDAAEGAFNLAGEYYLWDGLETTPPCLPADPACTQTAWRVYPQKVADNDWQAYWDANLASQSVSHIDVGDNLESVPWRTTSVVRVEMVPFAPSALTGFEMAFISGQGTDEKWGVKATNEAASVAQIETPGFATIYDSCMDLTLTKLATGSGDPNVEPSATQYTWDDSLDTWTGTAFTRKVDFSAEINVKGRVIYGYNWMLKREAMPAGIAKEGWWRLTFYNSCSTTSPLDFTDTTEDFDPTAPLPDEGEDGSGTVPTTYPREPVIDAGRDLVYIDIYIQAKTGGGGGGGGGGPR